MREFDHPPLEPHLPDIVDAIEASRTPFLALLHGNVLGGGLEIAMACAFRIASPETRLGLPEVNLGLVPGAGGTQRAPRLFGWDTAAEMACSGRLVTASEAAALGAVDQGRLTATATALMEIASPTGQAGAAADRLAELLAADGFEVERMAAGHPDAAAVITRLGGARPGPTL